LRDAFSCAPPAIQTELSALAVAFELALVIEMAPPPPLSVWLSTHT
jgi:hypothetical protein